MTALLEKLVSIIAPHSCVKCGNNDNILCDPCIFEVFLPFDSLCVLCEKPTVDWQICQGCAKKASLSSVWTAGEYAGVIAEVIKQYKFERAKAAHKVLAKCLDGLLPYLSEDVLLVPVPTAPSHIRQRGYDHALLITRQLAELRGLGVAQPLTRSGNLRQVGADRKQRFAQAEASYKLTRPELVKNKYVWLIDDICTTGATLSAAARLLKKAGAKQINAAVVGWQRLS